MITQITSSEEFQALFSEEDRTDPRKHVVIDFWAPWCGPCKMIEPVLEELASEFNEDMDIVQINIDDLPELASLYGVRSIPTMMFFHKETGSEEPTYRFVGSGSKEMYVDAINKYFFNPTTTEGN
jgi:thioredoxin 1